MKELLITKSTTLKDIKKFYEGYVTVTKSKVGFLIHPTVTDALTDVYVNVGDTLRNDGHKLSITCKK